MRFQMKTAPETTGTAKKEKFFAGGGTALKENAFDAKIRRK